MKKKYKEQKEAFATCKLDDKNNYSRQSSICNKLGKFKESRTLACIAIKCQ